jgi:hypothetical protein
MTGGPATISFSTFGDSFDFVVDLLEQLDIKNVKTIMQVDKIEIERIKGIIFA